MGLHCARALFASLSFPVCFPPKWKMCQFEILTTRFVPRSRLSFAASIFFCTVCKCVNIKKSFWSSFSDDSFRKNLVLCLWRHMPAIDFYFVYLRRYQSSALWRREKSSCAYPVQWSDNLRGTFDFVRPNWHIKVCPVGWLGWIVIPSFQTRDQEADASLVVECIIIARAGVVCMSQREKVLLLEGWSLLRNSTNPSCFVM